MSWKIQNSADKYGTHTKKKNNNKNPNMILHQKLFHCLTVDDDETQTQNKTKNCLINDVYNNNTSVLLIFRSKLKHNLSHNIFR